MVKGFTKHSLVFLVIRENNNVCDGDLLEHRVPIDRSRRRNAPSAKFH